MAIYRDLWGRTRLFIMSTSPHVTLLLKKRNEQEGRYQTVYQLKVQLAKQGVPLETTQYDPHTQL